MAGKSLRRTCSGFAGPTISIPITTAYVPTIVSKISNVALVYRNNSACFVRRVTVSSSSLYLRAFHSRDSLNKARTETYILDSAEFVYHLSQHLPVIRTGQTHCKDLLARQPDTHPARQHRYSVLLNSGVAMLKVMPANSER